MSCTSRRSTLRNRIPVSGSSVPPFSVFFGMGGLSFRKYMFNTYLVFQGDRRENFEQQIGQLDKPEEGCVNTHDTYTILRTALG